MLSLDAALAIVAHELKMEIPRPEPDGSRILELDDSLKLGIAALADKSGLIAWSVASERLVGETTAEAEARAHAFLRTHLGRLRQCGAVTATWSDSAEGLLFVRSVPNREKEWLGDVEAVLNETEAERDILASANQKRTGTKGAMSLFSGMSGLLGKR